MRLFSLWVFIPLASASKILLLPNQESSHIRALATTGRPLAERGHQVSIAVLYSQKQGPAVIGKMEQLLWGDANEKTYFSNKPETSKLFLDYYRKSHVNPKDIFLYTMFEWPRLVCDYLMKDKKLYDTVKARKFDLVIIDSLAITRCNFFFVHSLGVPYISQTAIFPIDISYLSQYFNSPFTTTSQLLPPGIYLHNDVGQQTFLQRCEHLIITIIMFTVVRYQQYEQYERYKIYWNDRPMTKSLSQLAAESQLWLIEQHPVLDFPRATYGNIKYIGGMTYKKSQPLTGKYAEIADSATGGFVTVSLGGDLLFLPKDYGDKMAAAFKKLPNYTFFWATKGELTEIPENVFIADWIPQNDLLGHKNCKLFVTHCGSNGQFEAVGHGIPMLGIPIHRDQPANAWRMKDKGYGLVINLHTVTADEIADKIKEDLTNPEYKNNIMKASAIFHDSAMTPTETAVYWIEHVLKHGGEYLKSDAMDMSWYQVLGYDIVTFFVMLVVFFIAVVKFTCSLIRNKMKGNKKKTKNE